ncbi:MAG: hypothetical protein J6O88_07185 [Chryseobacterium sp.]|uniref:XAC2610-related protein n=1 Tax=Chryseobacterium sp. TaxID=1871047 RepID=UPI001B2E0B14|nr:hypothetical protein [Chryseobacterium sp.]MBO6184462.1 hypothetical protein [Chryseobacterium sp.]
MKKLIILLFPCILLNAQKYKINDFSKDFYATITKNTKDKTSQILKVFAIKNKKPLITQDVHLDNYDFENTKSNIAEIPYGHQSIIIYDDFNFDGKKDIALKYGNESCYGGPSFVVYLYQKNGFVENSDFSDLAQNYCGFFDIDESKKQIHVMTKSGCCWHQYSDFIIKNGKPFLVKQSEEALDASGLYFETTVIEWKNKYTTHKYQTIATDIIPDNILTSYTLENNKKMYLIKTEAKDIYYFFTKKNGDIELKYRDIFFYSKKENSLSFGSGNIKYKIFNDRIEVTVNNVKTIINAKTKTRKNNISDIYNTYKSESLDNLEIVD